jgi:hypothetical protein
MYRQAIAPALHSNRPGLDARGAPRGRREWLAGLRPDLLVGVGGAVLVVFLFLGMALVIWHDR